MLILTEETKLCIDCIHVVSCEFDNNAESCNHFEPIPNVCSMDKDLNFLQQSIIKQGFIYCPHCGKKIYPEIDTFTDNNPDGTYVCNECQARFTLTFEGYEK